MKFTSDRQRRACFANMNRFSKGRIPNIGESVYIPGDPSVGIFDAYGTVVSVHDNSAEVRVGNSGDTEELGLEEFVDSVSLEQEKKFEQGLYKDWLEEQPLNRLHEMKDDNLRIGKDDKMLDSVLIEKRKPSMGKFAKEPNEDVRRHKLMPEDLKAKIPALYSQEKEKDPMVWGKFFSPYSGYTLYITEFDGDDTLFGYVTGMYEDELGYASLNELASAERDGLPLIERDNYFIPKRLSEVKKG
jgi:hypothetical protein